MRESIRCSCVMCVYHSNTCTIHILYFIKYKVAVEGYAA